MLQLCLLNEYKIYEHIFERYVQLENNSNVLEQDLGIHSRNNGCLELDIEPRKYNKVLDTFNLQINQSITCLNSSKDNNNSTTGYVLWSTSPFILKWILYSSDANILRNGGVLNVKDGNISDNPLHITPLFSKPDKSSYIIELGSGSSGLCPIVLSNYVNKYLATDQKGIIPLLKKNICNNLSEVYRRNAVSFTLEIDASRKTELSCQLEVLQLDWEKFNIEESDIDSLMTINTEHSLNIYVIAMDVIYNDFLIQPFLSTLTHLFKWYRDKNITISCLLGVQLRAQNVIENFLEQAIVDFGFTIYFMSSDHLIASRFNLYYIK